MIEVGDYVRTKEKGYIGRILSIDECNEWIETTLEKEYTHHIDEFKIKPKIIDLIEVGDYVNGHRVITEKDKNKCNSIRLDNGVLLENQDIKTILTHEQYKQNCCKVGVKE